MRLTPLFLFAAAALVGCSTFDSRIRTNPKTGALEMRLPKDAKFDLFEYRKTFLDVLGRPVTVELVLSNADFRMNPDVIDAKTRRDVELIKAGGAAGASVLGALPK